MASRLRRYLKRAGARAKVLAGRGAIVSGQVTEYVAPAVVGYLTGSPVTGAAAGAALGTAGELQIASGRNLAGKKRQNVRVKVQQGAVRGAVIGGVTGGARALVDYLASSPDNLQTVQPKTTTVSTSTPAGSPKTQGAQPITVTKAGSTVEFDTSSGQATVKTSSGGSALLDPKTLLSGGATGLISAAAGLLGQPGGGPLNLPGGYGIDFGGGGGGVADPGSLQSSSFLGLSPTALVVVAAVILLAIVL